ncbi:MAG: hypothetical protein P4L87_25520 [Formivibrio sp.]|nr:hypothetical protein [Formivibrio sp.]
MTSESRPKQTSTRWRSHTAHYVSISRGAQDAQIFTNDASALGKVLSRDVSHAPAIEPEAIMQKIAPQSVPIEEIVQELGIGL